MFPHGNSASAMGIQRIYISDGDAELHTNIVSPPTEEMAINWSMQIEYQIPLLATFSVAVYLEGKVALHEST